MSSEGWGGVGWWDGGGGERYKEREKTQFQEPAHTFLVKPLFLALLSFTLFFISLSLFPSQKPKHVSFQHLVRIHVIFEILQLVHAFRNWKEKPRQAEKT